MDKKVDKFMKFLVLGNVLVALILSGCNAVTDKRKIQYMPDMADTPTVKPQEDYLDPPDHSVSTSSIIYPEDMAVAEREFRNPIPASKENLIEGKKYYATYCALCHGDNGKGGGTLTDAYPKAMVPDITRADLKTRKDGFFFSKISMGGPNMPSYGHATTPQERWQIILHLRTLQGL